MEQKWIPIVKLPEPGKRLGRYWVIVEGEEFHSGIFWNRKRAGLARTDSNGFVDCDIRAIEKEGHMDACSGVVTYFTEIFLPPLP